MKLELFKKLIKEAVREVLKEELSTYLVEQKQAPVTQVQQVTKYGKYTPTPSKIKPTGDPIMDMLNETRASMTQEEYRDMSSMTSNMVGPGMNPLQHFNQGPEPGIDLSTLDFVKNAGAIYKASVEKDRQKFGA